MVADVDGTLVTKEKVLTERARNAVRKLQDVGIAFTEFRQWRGGLCCSVKRPLAKVFCDIIFGLSF